MQLGDVDVAVVERTRATIGYEALNLRYPCRVGILDYLEQVGQVEQLSADARDPIDQHHRESPVLRPVARREAQARDQPPAIAGPDQAPPAKRVAARAHALKSAHDVS